MEFVLADGTSVHRSVSECYLTLPQGEGHSPVVLGQPGDAEPLLGVVTLEILGLVFDPFRRVLQPMRALLKADPSRLGRSGDPSRLRRSG